MLFAGVDLAHGKDMTAVCIAEQMKDASIRILAFAESFTAITQGAISALIHRTLRDLARPKGYSRSHWRKIYRQSPSMQPINIVLDSPTLGEGPAP